jgi:LPXTG-motif cell wall-anchored protein
MGKAFLTMAGSMSKSSIGLLITMVIAIIAITGYFLLRRKNK